MKFATLLSLAPAFALLSVGAPAFAEPESVAPPIVFNSCQFRADMRKLWEEHVTWTRLFIIADAANLPDKASTLQRLLKNQRDIGAAIIPFYGVQAGMQLTQLLTDHILISGKVLDAAKSRNNNALNQANALWLANANAIAKFLNAANPQNWPFSALQGMMLQHLQLTTNEALDYINGRYAKSASDFDLVENEILMMSDSLSSGIEKQFPGRFR